MSANKLVEINLKYDNTELLARARRVPKKVERVARVMANKVSTDLYKSLGGKIPKSAKTQIRGFRRVRTKKSRATLRRNRAVVWLGGNEIAAKYGGRLRKGVGGAYAGTHFFKDGFIAKMKSGYRSIFRHGDGSRLKEATFKVPDMYPIAIREIRLRIPQWESELKDRLDAALTGI